MLKISIVQSIYSYSITDDWLVMVYGFADLLLVHLDVEFFTLMSRTTVSSAFNDYGVFVFDFWLLGSSFLLQVNFLA